MSSSVLQYADSGANGNADARPNADCDGNTRAVGYRVAECNAGSHNRADDYTVCDAESDALTRIRSAESRSRGRRLVRIDGDDRFGCMDLAWLLELISS